MVKSAPPAPRRKNNVNTWIRFTQPDTEPTTKTAHYAETENLWNKSDSDRSHFNPDYDTLLKIADYFDVTTDYLLGKTDNPKVSHSGTIGDDKADCP